jgi:hypothetical protein
MIDSLFALWLAITSGIYGPPPVDVPAEKAQVSTDKPVDVAGDAVACKVQANGRKIVAFATASNQPRSGAYTLEIEKSSPNTAKSRQRGTFDLAAGETKPLATVAMSIGSGEHLKGHLSVTWNGGETTCGL